jgi:hypothetical protein
VCVCAVVTRRTQRRGRGRRGCCARSGVGLRAVPSQPQPRAKCGRRAAPRTPCRSPRLSRAMTRRGTRAPRARARSCARAWRAAPVRGAAHPLPPNIY